MMSSRKVPMLLSCFFPTVQNNTSVKQRQKKWLLRCALMLYSISGWATPLLLDRLRLSEPSIDTTRRGPGVASFHLPNLLPMISNTLGMAVAWLVVSSVAPGGSPLLKRLRRLPWTVSLWRRLGAVAVVDFFSGFLIIQGQLNIPSNLFVVLYASCTLWTALLSRCILRRSLARLQWIAIIAITVGLAGDAATSLSHGSSAPKAPREISMTLGIFDSPDLSSVLMVLVGSMLHSLMFVQAEALSSGIALGADEASRVCSGGTISSTIDDASALVTTTKKNNTFPLSPRSQTLETPSASLRVSTIDVCGFMGCTELAVLVLLHAIFHFPQFLFRGGAESDSLRGYVSTDVLSSTSTDSNTAGEEGRAFAAQRLAYYGVLACINAVHAASFFALLESLGAITSGVLKGLQMLVVFAASDLLFCASDGSECVTVAKSSCVAIVFAGLVLYGLGGSPVTTGHLNSRIANESGVEDCL